MAPEWRLSPATATPRREGCHREKVLLEAPSQKVHFLPGLGIQFPSFVSRREIRVRQFTCIPQSLRDPEDRPQAGSLRVPSRSEDTPGELIGAFR